MPVTIERSIQLHERRCRQCGRWWASEFASDSLVGCPRCQDARIDQLNGESAKQWRGISALKGQNKRLRRQLAELRELHGHTMKGGVK